MVLVGSKFNRDQTYVWCILSTVPKWQGSAEAQQLRLSVAAAQVDVLDVVGGG